MLKNIERVGCLLRSMKNESLRKLRSDLMNISIGIEKIRK